MLIANWFLFVFNIKVFCIYHTLVNLYSTKAIVSTCRLKDKFLHFVLKYFFPPKLQYIKSNNLLFILNAGRPNFKQKCIMIDHFMSNSKTFLWFLPGKKVQFWIQHQINCQFQKLPPLFVLFYIFHIYQIELDKIISMNIWIWSEEYNQ